MAVAANPFDNSPAAAVEGRSPEQTAEDFFARFGKEHSYEVAEFLGRADPFWQDVASLIDAMSPCAYECGRPGVGFYNDVFACEACGERILGGMR